MLKIRKSHERGILDHGWLLARHTFSFGSYFDANYLGFHDLKVINQDEIAPSKGFGSHSHQDMEIITFVMEGALEHKDSLGNGEVIWPYEFQRMSAGAGIVHSEFNHLSDASTKLYQIWIETKVKGIEPSYEQKKFQNLIKSNQLTLVVSPQGEDGSMKIYQDAKMFFGRYDSSCILALKNEKKYWLQMLKGRSFLNDLEVCAEDGLAIENETELNVDPHEQIEFLLFELK